PKKTNNNRITKANQYKAYYGITLIETLMSVGLLGVVLIPMLMTSTAYLSTKLLKHRSTTELSQNVNALGTKLNTLTASTAGVNPLTATNTNLELMVKNPDGTKRVYQYSIVGTAGTQRLREFQGTSQNRTSASALRSLNEDATTIVGTAGFSYCSATACTTPTNSAAQNQIIARTAQVVVFDGDTTTNVTRDAAGVVTGADPVWLLYNAGDNGRKRTVLPNNILPLGTDPTVANNNFQPSPDVSNPALGPSGPAGPAGHVGTTTNRTPFGLIKVATKAQVYGNAGAGGVNADLRLTSGSGSSFTTLPLNQGSFSRAYHEAPGNTAAGNDRPILRSFKLDQTVADSFQGNMCFSGNRQVGDVFQVYYWNRTMREAALTSVQSASTVADPFAVTPECRGYRPGYNAYDPAQGEYYVTTTPRKAWKEPTTTTKTAPSGYTKHRNAGSWGWQLWSDNDTGRQWQSFAYGSNGYHGYYYSSGTHGHNNSFMGIGQWDGFIFDYYTANNLGVKTVPLFAWNPNTLGITDDHTIGAADEAGQLQYQVQPVWDNGTHVLIHKRGNDGYIAKPVNEIDPIAGNHQRNLYLRRMKNFAVYGTEGGWNGTTCRNRGLNNIIVNAHHQWDHDICSELYNIDANDFWWKSEPANTTVQFKITNFREYQTWEAQPYLRISGYISGYRFYATSIRDENHPTRNLNPKNFLSLSIGDNPISGNLFAGEPVYNTYDSGDGPRGRWQYNSECDCYAFVPDPPTYYIGNYGYSWCELQQNAADPTVYGCMYGTPLPGDINGADYQYKGANVDTKGHVSQRNAFERSEYAPVTVRNYLNPNPTVSPAIDTINIPLGAEAPYIIREDSGANANTGYLFYSKTSPDGITRLYNFNQANQKLVVSPVINGNWGSIATSKLTAGKRVLSYSPNNKVAVTGNTSGYGDVFAWYYDDVDLPISMTRKGGLGFNAAQANSPIVNYIAREPGSTAGDIIGNNITTTTTEGNTLYTFNKATGTLTAYGGTIGTQNFSRQSQTILANGIGADDTSAIAVSPMDDGLYFLNGGMVRYYADRRGGANLTHTVSTITIPTSSTRDTLAGANAQILLENFGDFETLGDANKNNFDNISNFGELQTCANACTDIIVQNAAAYFVNNRPVFEAMETISGGANDDWFNSTQLSAYRTQQANLPTPATTTNRSISLPVPTQAVNRLFNLNTPTVTLTTPTGLAVSKATGLVYVLDSTIKPDTDPTRKLLNIHVYQSTSARSQFVETLSLDVSDNLFVNSADRLLPQSGGIMRLTLDERTSQFYIHVEGNGRVYQFSVDRVI
ncbi:MAG: hypothetical protein NTW61_00905, partial [Candidatus Melainabacteria bacterium]|nr:hypothetical protein [Candidatus Melainabacteria bacterium]